MSWETILKVKRKLELLVEYVSFTKENGDIVKSTFDRARFLPAELVNITPFLGLFFVDFFRNFQEKLRRFNA